MKIVCRCDSCPYYDRERRQHAEETLSGPSAVTEYQHRCWRDPIPVIRSPWTRDKVIRACAHKPVGNVEKGGYHV